MRLMRVILNAYYQIIIHDGREMEVSTLNIENIPRSLTNTINNFDGSYVHCNEENNEEFLEIFSSA